MPNFFNKYPYTDFHELNLDWILSKVKELETEVRLLDRDALYSRSFVTPDMFGAKHDTDATAAFQTMLDSPYDFIKINGEYSVNRLVIPSGKLIIGDNAVLNVSDHIEINSKKDITLDNIVFKGVATGQEIVLSINYSHDITVSNCEFTGTYAGTITGLGIVDVRYSNDCNFINDVIHGSNAEGLLIDRSKHCIIRGGKYYDNLRGSGIHVGGPNGEDHGYHLIDGAECYNNIGSNIGISGKQNICVNCFIHDNDSTTFAIAGGHAGSGATNCVIANNILLRNNNNIYLYDCTDSIVTGNIIDGDGKANPITPNENNGIAGAANAYNIVASNNDIKGCTNGIVGISKVVGNKISSCTRGVNKGANPAIDTEVDSCTITDCNEGCRNCIAVRNCTFDTAASCIAGEGLITGNNMTSGNIAIYEGSSSNLSLITNNIIKATGRAIYSSKQGVFEYNMLTDSHTISAGNMTTTNNYLF